MRKTSASALCTTSGNGRHSGLRESRVRCLLRRLNPWHGGPRSPRRPRESSHRDDRERQECLRERSGFRNCGCSLGGRPVEIVGPGGQEGTAECRGKPQGESSGPGKKVDQPVLDVVYGPYLINSAASFRTLTGVPRRRAVSQICLWVGLPGPAQAFELA